MDERIPPIVEKLAERVKLTPIAWKIHPDRVVIVFQEGAKISFDLVGSVNEVLKNDPTFETKQTHAPATARRRSAPPRNP